MEDPTTTDTPAPPAPENKDEYAIVEIFGHRRLAGRVIEVEKFGTKLLRIDIPEKGKFENGFTTQMYGGASLFSVTPCDLATVEAMNKPYQPPSVLVYRAPDPPDDAPDGEEETPEEDQD